MRTGAPFRVADTPSVRVARSFWNYFTRALGAGLCASIFVATCYAGGNSTGWEPAVRERVAAHDLSAALQIVDARLAIAPQDLEARGWRGRLLAWTGRWAEAESEYRRVLEAAPHDVDVLVGLSYVLIWQKRYHEALVLLDRASEIDPARADTHLARGRSLRAQGLESPAKREFQEALTLEPGNQDARDALTGLLGEPRFTLVSGTDVDTFNYTGTSEAVTTAFIARIGSAWTAAVSGTGQNRFGSQAGSFLLSLGYRFTRRDGLSVGGGTAHDGGVIPKDQAFFEYVHTFVVGPQKFIRAVGASYHQHWYWYRGAHVCALTPRLELLLPHQWAWSFQITDARSGFSGLPIAWTPSGLTRLNFPLHKALEGSLFYAVGTEDFALSDQVGHFAARTLGGGLSYQVSPRQKWTGYLAAQDRSQARSQFSYGISYAVNF